MAASVKELVTDFTKALEDESAAFFIGAGISKSSGFVDWKEMMRDIASDLGLDVDKETDLIALAQYHFNSKQSRAKINQHLIEEFTKDANLTSNHHLIANLPVHTIWTTNYDNLIERAFEAARKQVDVKYREPQLAFTKPGRVVTIYKVHGDANNPDEAVLTKNDYELFESKRKLFSIQLQGHLVSKTFVFLGYSLNDPNIEYILSRIRTLLGTDARQHFCLMRRESVPKGSRGSKKATHEYAKKRHEHRVLDLQRYNIQAVLMDDYSEVTEILERISERTHMRDVFVSGSAAQYGPFGEDRIHDLCDRIGNLIIKEKLNLVSGFGLGIGGRVINGAFNALTVNDPDRLLLRPFPQEIPADKRKEVWTRYRDEMIRQAGFCVFISGNKLEDGSNEPIIADGVLEEFKICKQLKRRPIPIGATGFAAEQIWKEVNASLGTFYAHPTKVRDAFKVIGNTESTVPQIAKAVFEIIKEVRQW
jgi:Sir2- and TIR-associating SLOG family/SIR2-like domain